MKKYIILSVLLCGLLASGAGGGLFGKWGDNEEQIRAKDLPVAVLQTVTRIFPQGEIRKAEKDTEHKREVFDVAVAVEGALYSVEMAADGKLIKVELEDDHGNRDEALPDKARGAVLNMFPNGKIEDVDRNKAKTQVLYTVKVRDGENERVVVVNDHGNVLKIAGDAEGKHEERENAEPQGEAEDSD